MKRKLLIIMMAALAAVAFSACEKENMDSRKHLGRFLHNKRPRCILKMPIYSIFCTPRTFDPPSSHTKTQVVRQVSSKLRDPTRFHMESVSGL